VDLGEALVRVRVRVGVRDLGEALPEAR